MGKAARPRGTIAGMRASLCFRAEGMESHIFHASFFFFFLSPFLSKAPGKQNKKKKKTNNPSCLIRDKQIPPTSLENLHLLGNHLAAFTASRVPQR